MALGLLGGNEAFDVRMAGYLALLDFDVVLGTDVAYEN